MWCGVGFRPRLACFSYSSLSPVGPNSSQRAYPSRAVSDDVVAHVCACVPSDQLEACRCI